MMASAWQVAVHARPHPHPHPVPPIAVAAAEATAAAPFMTVTTSGAGPEDKAGKLELRNPDGVSEAAIEDGLDLYDRIVACEDPKLKGALESAIQVLQQYFISELFLQQQLITTP